MFSFILRVFFLLFAANYVFADVITTIRPCPACPQGEAPPPIVVTAQYQVVSTCRGPSSVCVKQRCSTTWPYTTYAFVSTTVPCAYDGSEQSSTVITNTQQTVTIATSTETVTSYVQVPTNPLIGWLVKPSYTSVALTVSREYQLQYQNMGPIALPGYPGNGICQQCQQPGNSGRNQVLDVIECTSGGGYLGLLPLCIQYKETWIAPPAPSTTSVVVVPCATQFYAPSAGYYTFNFPQTAPPAVIKSAAVTFDVNGFPWFAEAVYYAGQPATYHMTTHVTSTITWDCPYETKSAST